MQKTVVVVEPEHTFIIIIIHVHHETRTQREVISGGIGSQSKSHALPFQDGGVNQDRFLLMMWDGNRFNRMVLNFHIEIRCWLLLLLSSPQSVRDQEAAGALLY